MAVLVQAVDRPELPPFRMPDRFRQEIVYFSVPAGSAGVPELQAGEYWVRLEEARRWAEEGVIELISPLTSENQAEVELSEEQQDWLDWMVAHGVEHIRLQ